jgi:hypothetical protein
VDAFSVSDEISHLVISESPLLKIREDSVSEGKIAMSEKIYNIQMYVESK